MNLLDIYHSTGGKLEYLNINEILQTNHESQKYGLLLTYREAQELVRARDRAIRGHGRVDLGVEVVKKLIAAFSKSSYINNADFASTLNDLVEIFYYMKNETEDKMGDDDLIALMNEFFDNSSRGSLELLKNRDLTLFAQNFRKANQANDLYRQEEQL
jgi:hypothetical protein